MISLEVLSKDGTSRYGKNDYEEIQRPLIAQGEDFVSLATQDLTYEEGDLIEIKVDQPGYYWAKLDECLDTSLVYISDTTWRYHISLTKNAIDARPDNAFLSKRHYLSVRKATKEQLQVHQNLALNPLDQKEFHGAYPHAHANVETRNDATFFACNAIDGIAAPDMHGEYPYQSWGINRQEDAALTIDFGRPVLASGVGIVLRADFPHDSFWTAMTVTFSDGSKETLNLKKANTIQTFAFAPRTIDSLTINTLIKHEDDSPFPALTEFEVYGQHLI
ncbi:hypothetical protein [Lapidilactobacillus luobeiensis]|uniref:hypothetical protein n=1 Tax=Lapidilactobacillus luobeiensis TaxID=2950371 RepID=UPI0021C497A9|nr:hypothetical protein [Lapidilactobacillus luobeiensis]